MNDLTKIEQKIEAKINTDVSGQIAISDQGISFSNAGEVMEFAKMMAVSQSAVPKHLRGNPGACLGIIDDAIRFGMSPYGLARKSFFVNDNLGYEAQVLSAIINSRAPIKDRPDIEFIGEGVEKICRVTVELLSGKVRTVDSPKLGSIHPKNSPLWKTDEDQQLSYHTLRRMCRRHFPEVLLGVYDIEELLAFRATDVTPERPLLADRVKDAAQKVEPEDNEGFDSNFVTQEIETVTTEEEPSEEVATDAPNDELDLGATEDAEASPDAPEPDYDPMAELPGERREAVSLFAKEYYGGMGPSVREDIRAKHDELFQDKITAAPKIAAQLKDLIDKRQIDQVCQILGKDEAWLKGTENGA